MKANIYLKAHKHNLISYFKDSALKFLFVLISNNVIWSISSAMKVNFYLNVHLHSWIILFTESLKRGIKLCLFSKSFIFNYVAGCHVFKLYQILMQFIWETNLRLSFQTKLKQIFRCFWETHTSCFLAFFKTQIPRTRMNFTYWLLHTDSFIDFKKFGEVVHFLNRSPGFLKLISIFVT